MNAKIPVIDDEEGIRFTFQRLLKTEGHVVAMAESCSEAWTRMNSVTLYRKIKRYNLIKILPDIEVSHVTWNKRNVYVACNTSFLASYRPVHDTPDLSLRYTVTIWNECYHLPLRHGS